MNARLIITFVTLTSLAGALASVAQAAGRWY
jgi:hypothetical protein